MLEGILVQGPLSSGKKGIPGTAPETSSPADTWFLLTLNEGTLALDLQTHAGTLNLDGLKALDRKGVAVSGIRSTHDGLDVQGRVVVSNIVPSKAAETFTASGT
ncbi:MAG: hypothetical protein AAFS10_22900, partial [Myxococcota bacterium]